MLKNNKFQKEWHSATKPLKKIFGEAPPHSKAS
jgi:hypothetical protein